MYKIILSASLSLLLVLTTMLGAIDDAKASGPKLIRIYKVNKQQQTTRLRISDKKARQPGCHNLFKRTRVHRAMQIGYVQCQLFTEKECAEDSLVAVSRENKAELVEDADKRRQAILTNIVQQREAKAREEAVEKQRSETDELSATTETDKKIPMNEQSVGATDKQLDDAPSKELAKLLTDEAPDGSASAEIATTNDANDAKGSGAGNGEDELIIVKKDYEAIEAELLALLETVPEREKIIASTPDSLSEKLTEGVLWYPETDDLRGVKVRSWSCSLVD